MKSETAFLQRLTGSTGPKPADLLLGIGDDAAVFRPTPGRVLTAASDLLTEGIHFQRDYFSGFDIGAKALLVNLSDMAAMGAVPRWCLMNLALPANFPDQEADAIVRGLLETAKRFGVTLIGGDTSASTGPVFIGVTILGETRPGAWLTRSGARPGDAIFVSGVLGDSEAGRLMLSRGDISGEHSSEAVEKHLRPVPRLELGRFLVSSGACTAAMDLSDGLSIDLKRMCESSRTGALLLGNRIPASRGAEGEAEKAGKSRLDLALNGGEDFELLFTIQPEMVQKIELLSGSEQIGGVRLTQIGTIEPAETGIRIDSGKGPEPLPSRGFDHFSNDSAT